MWPDKIIAEAHYHDLIKVKAKLEKDKNCEPYRLKTVIDMIRIADAERHMKEEKGIYI